MLAAGLRGFENWRMMTEESGICMAASKRQRWVQVKDIFGDIWMGKKGMGDGL